MLISIEYFTRMFGEGLEPHQLWFYHWINEREKCRIGREQGLTKPWSADPILQSYRFCNVRREDDTVTKWIHTEWLGRHEGSTPSVNMVLAMIVARTVNSINTLIEIGFPDHMDFDGWLLKARVAMKTRRANGFQVWTGAYLVSTNGHAMDKIDYILDNVWTPFAKNARPPYDGETLECYHKYLMNYDGLGSFMAGQVIADLKFSSVLKNAPDWKSWAPIGPGSKRGLNRYFGRPIEKSIPDSQALAEFSGVQLQVLNRLGLDLAVHNIQNCFCEYDKYLRVKLGEGKPRSTYPGRG